MSFQRLSERVEGKSRPPESRWKVVPQSRTGGWETPIIEFVMCSWHKQLRMSLKLDRNGRRPMSDRRRQSSARYAGATPPSEDAPNAPPCLRAWKRELTPMQIIISESTRPIFAKLSGLAAVRARMIAVKWDCDCSTNWRFNNQQATARGTAGRATARLCLIFILPTTKSP